MTRRRKMSFVAIVACLALLPWQVALGAERLPWRGQLLYVPVYSEIPFGDQPRTLNLTVILSIRNTNRTASITVTRVEYYDSSGRPVRSYLTARRSLAPLAAMECIVQESDRSGGISASFLVEWVADGVESPPLVEAVMIGTRSGQGISFATRAHILEEKR